jgi:hypothetical protein
MSHPIIAQVRAPAMATFIRSSTLALSGHSLSKMMAMHQLDSDLLHGYAVWTGRERNGK